MTRVAYYLDAQHYGGVELSALTLLRHLDRSRFEPVVYFRCADPVGDDEMRRVFRELAIPVRELDGDGLPSAECGLPTNGRVQVPGMPPVPERRKPLRHLVRAWVPKGTLIVWYHLRKTVVVAAVFRRDRLDAIHFLHAYYPSLEIPLLASRLAGIPVRLSDVQTEPMVPAPKGWIRRLIAGTATGCATHVRAMSEDIARSVRERCRIQLRSIRVIVGGVDLARFTPYHGGRPVRQGGEEWSGRPEGLFQRPRPLGRDTGFTVRPRASTGQAPSGKTVVVVARLSPEKGHRVLIEAVEMLKDRHPQARYLFAGDGPLRDELEREVAVRGLTRCIQFLGFRRDVPELLEGADLVVLPSLTEGLPWAVLESMASGKPIVATRVGAVGEVVEDGVTGRLVEPGDPKALAQALDAMLGCDPRTLDAMGRAARQRAEERFSQRRMVEAFEGGYALGPRTRVAFYLETRDHAGVELSALTLLRHLDRSRFEPVVYFQSSHAAGNEAMRKAFRALQIPVRELDVDGLPLLPQERPASDPPPTGYAVSPAGHRSVVRQLVRPLIPQGAFPVWYHLRKTVAVATVFRRDRLDAIHFLHTYYPSLEIPLLAARLAGIPVRLSDVQTEPMMLPPHGRVRRAIARFASQCATLVRAMSSQIVDPIRASCGMPRSRIRVIMTGLNLDAFPFHGAPASAVNGDGERTVAVVARLSPEKGHRFLIEAVDALKDRYPQVRYLCIGDGPIRQDLERDVAARGLDRWIQFLGFRRDVHQLIKQSAFLLLPSLSEGIPWVVLEAMALGKPVLATRVGAVTDVMVDGETGRLIAPGDPAVLTHALDELLAADPRTLEVMGRAARKRIEDHFSRPLALVDAFQDCYAVGRHHPSTRPADGGTRSGFRSAGIPAELHGHR